MKTKPQALPLSTRHGFTLIELMIVVAIIAVLAAIAYPSYSEQVARSRRADGKGALLEVAQWIERQYTVSNAYNKQGDGSTLSTSELQANAPRKATTDYYDISFVANPSASAVSASSYWLQAVPKGAMVNDKCGSLYLEHTGARGITGTGATVAACWDK